MTQQTPFGTEPASTSATLVINCGSSSVKFSLIKPLSGETLLSGLAECLHTSDAKIIVKINGGKQAHKLPEPFNHQTALSVLVEQLQQLDLVKDITAVGHRVVHGGEQYSQPTLITQEVEQAIEQLAKLAPLHNPANLIGIKACQTAFKDLPQVAVFDTAFHQSMPDKAYVYGLPYSLYKEHGIRRYGFHGTSHYFVAKQAAEQLNKPFEQCNLISAHLGNGCSVTVIKNGESVDTSMGMTPGEGVIMGTRCGDLDTGIIFHLVENLGYSIAEVDKLVNKESGLLGISGLSNDGRTLEEAMLAGNHAQATLALTVFCYRIAKTIASYSASLTQLDGLIFTGGIGENSSWVRTEIVKQLALLNFSIDEEKNASTRFGASGNIAAADSRACWVIATNEEWVIAEQSAQLLSNLAK
ncbi:acetate/propionate family kinase [Colwellia psychrerythraea]|uniref:Acetate kinase n=1 Tax=Colwellia psychrerythraea TaxID=28229 RepID=A0A099KAU8_COLPS|nr:acetate kinase [Colwellia psychrerythraea]KGJ86718.1 Acetate kinase [Colwellia psychrerythraea]